ncbi:GntR family transcriptional regulator OS=Streptomyces fumanus OX=67302 GN=GCM10018772_43080 PE=3 SV=1 [Streptomyces fumanus]
MLRARGVHTVAVESYGLHFHRDLLTAAGLRTVPLPDDDRGTDPRSPACDAGAVLLTPAHQFPMGEPLRPDRRAAVVDWARRTGALVLEDDYDGEFRYDRQTRRRRPRASSPERVDPPGHRVSKCLAPGAAAGLDGAAGRGACDGGRGGEGRAARPGRACWTS